MRATLTAALATALLASSLSAQTLANPGFENGPLGPGAQDWNAFGNAFTEDDVTAGFPAQAGTQMLKMFGNFSGGFDVTGAFQAFPAAEGDAFFMDCYSRVSGNDPLIGAGPPNDNWAVMKLAFFDAPTGGNEIGSAEATVADGNSPVDVWIDNTPIVGIAPAGTQRVEALLLFLQPFNDGGSAYFDSVEFGAVQNTCGSESLTTPPNFLSNNGGSVGGAVYFTLDVTDTNGISICGIDVNAGSGPATGEPLEGLLYLNLVSNDVTVLATGSPELAASNWCPLGLLTGTAAGVDVPSIMELANPVDLAPGQYMFALVGNWGHAYTNGDASNNTAVGTGLTFVGGKASNVPFSGTVFSSSTTAPFRLFNGTFRYDLATAPVSTTACGSVAQFDPVGAGCGGAAAQVYEEFAGGAFDLTTEDLVFSAGGADIVTTTAPATPIVPPLSPDLALGDDQNTTLLPLGFTVIVGGVAIDAVSIASNGYVWLGTTGPADFSPSESEFVNQGARLALFWTDLNPLAGGTIHLDLASDLALVTFQGVFPFGGSQPEVTAQLEITPTGLRCRYDTTAAAFANGALVGLSNGQPPAAAPGSVDLNGGAVPTVSGGSNLELFCDAPPRIGSIAEFRTIGIEPGVIAVTLLSFGGPVNPGVPLPTPVYAPGCEMYTTLVSFNIGLVVGPAGTVPVSIANEPSLVGERFTLQSADLAPAITTSNALDCVVGNL